MLDTVIKAGDLAVFDPQFFGAFELKARITIAVKGSSLVSTEGKKYCLQSDVLKVSQEGVPFFDLAKNTMVTGSIAISALLQGQKSMVFKGTNDSNGTQGEMFVLKGQQFMAQAKVDGVPAPGLGKFEPQGLPLLKVSS